MKVLIVGATNKWAIENIFIKYLRKQDCEIDVFPAHDLFYNYYNQSIANKLLFRLHVSGIYKKINRSLLDFCTNKNYNLIWVFKGMEIFPETLDILKNRGIKLVNYNPDHPFDYVFKGSGNSNVTNSVGKYDAHFCYSIPVLKKIETDFNIPCAWLPFAYEPKTFKFPSEEEEILRACFIGTPDNYRTEIIMEMNKAGIAIDVFDDKWNNFLKKTEMLRVYKNEYKKTAPATHYRMQLNIFKPYNDNSHNMRTFEMPGVGCIELSPDSYEQRLLFEKDKEIFLYKDISDAIEQAKKILNLSYTEALKIRQAAYKRATESGYTFEERTKQVYEWFNQIINSTFSFSS